MFTLLMIALGALFLYGLHKYTIGAQQAWAEEWGEALGLEAESRGVGTILRGKREGVAVWIALSGRRVTEGEARLVHRETPPTFGEYRRARARFRSIHYKQQSVWGEFPTGAPGESPEPYLDALLTVAAFAAQRSPDELYAFDHADATGSGASEEE